MAKLLGWCNHTFPVAVSKLWRGAAAVTLPEPFRASRNRRCWGADPRLGRLGRGSAGPTAV